MISFLCCACRLKDKVPGRLNEKDRFHSLSEQLVKKYNYECVLARALIVLIKIYCFILCNFSGDGHFLVWI